jgi:hypothetical protein
MASVASTDIDEVGAVDDEGQLCGEPDVIGHRGGQAGVFNSLVGLDLLAPENAKALNIKREKRLNPT